MLVSLRLTNFAVMEEVEVAFGPGLTVLTGETGAGKSMLMDALGLVVGGRAEADVVRAGAQEACVEALFERTEELGRRLAEFGLADDGPEVAIRRTIGLNGRGKVSINGGLSTVGTLGRLLRGLVDIAGQHEHMALFDPAGHLGLVDRFGGLTTGEGPLGAYQSAWVVLRDCDTRLVALGGDEGQVQARREFLAFQLEEIDRIGPQPGEDVALDLERRKLASVERLRQGAGQAEELVATRDGSALELLSRALHLVADAEKLDPNLAPVREALTTARVELDEGARALSRYLGGLETDPRRLSEVDDRLDALRRLCRKHAAPLEGVIARRQGLAEELDQLAHRAERRSEVELERQRALAEVLARGGALTQARQAAAQRLEHAVLEGLGRLSMGRASFSVAIVEGPPGLEGCCKVEFLFSANPGEPARGMARVASGGEASRVMLAMKAALAGTEGVGCSVFDEADAGVGGAVADVVGRLIKDVSAHRQVLCITHLPQVAAHADTHLRLEKAETRGRVRSVVQVLPPGDPRAQELARMLSGVEVTREALGAAEALLRNAQRVLAPLRARKRPGRPSLTRVSA